jgi:hypothetical protein
VRIGFVRVVVVIDFGLEFGLHSVAGLMTMTFCE